MSEDPRDPSSKLDLERRRVPLERKISLKFKEFRGFITEVSENISLGGMFIRTSSPKPPGTIFDFELALTDDFKLLQGIGEVVWIRQSDSPDRPSGMGIRFLDLSPESRKLIERIVDEQVARGGTPFELEPQGFPPPPIRAPASAPGAHRGQATAAAAVFHPTAAPVAPPPPMPRPARAAASAPPPRATPPSAPPPAAPRAPEPPPQEAFQFELEPLELDAADAGHGSIALPEASGELLPSLSESWDAESLEPFPMEDAGAAALGVAEPLPIEETPPGGEPTPLDDRTRPYTPPVLGAAALAPTDSAEEGGSVWRSPSAPIPPRRRQHLPELDEVARAFGEPTESATASDAAAGDATVRLAGAPRAPEPLPASPAVEVPPEPPPQRASLSYSQPGRRSTPPPRKRSLALPITLVVLLLIVGGAAALWFFFPALLPPWANALRGDHGPSTAVLAPRAQATKPAAVTPATTPPVVAVAPAAPSPGGGATGPRTFPSLAPPVAVGQGQPPAAAVPAPPSPAQQAAKPPAAPQLPSPLTPIAPPAKSAGAAKGHFSAVEEIWGQRTAAGTVVTIVGNGVVPQGAFSHFRLEGPNPREVVRVRGVDGSFKRPTIAVGTGEVKQIRTGYHAETGGGELHVVVDLTSPRVKLLRLEAVDNRIELLLSQQ